MSIFKYLFLSLLFLLPLFHFIRKKDAFSFVAVFGLILIIYGTLRGYSEYNHRYLIPIFPFFILSCISLLNSFKKIYQRRIILFILLLFSLSAIKTIDSYLLSPEFHTLRPLVESGFSLLPAQGKILSDNSYFLRFAPKIDLKQVNIIPLQYDTDLGAGKRLETIGVAKKDYSWRTRRYITLNQLAEIKNITQQIINKEYAFIVIGPTSANSPVFEILDINYQLSTPNSSYDGDFNQYEEKLNTRYHFTCSINLPTLLNPCPNCDHTMSIRFINISTSDCILFGENIIDNEISKFDKICSLDRELSNVVFRTYPDDIKLAKNLTCHKNKHLIIDLSRGMIATFRELLFLFFLGISILYYYLKTSKQTHTS
ncbi:hypothetical protein HZB00_03285 [Candidatus Woesearchaeota archaeon]|nr:hypothetical protein [Candidatus Woesearchaeota archaeon]